MKLPIKEFPEVEIIVLQDTTLTILNTYLPPQALFFKFLNILEHKRENKILDKIIDDYKIDGVISDSRFGLYTKKVQCVFLTHQLKIKSPFLINIFKI